MIVNDSGKNEGLEFNRTVRDKKGEVIDIIAGDFFICYAPPDNSELSSLPDELIQKYTEVFKTPQAFIDIGGKMLVVPVDE